MRAPLTVGPHLLLGAPAAAHDPVDPQQILFQDRPGSRESDVGESESAASLTPSLLELRASLPRPFSAEVRAAR